MPGTAVEVPYPTAMEKYPTVRQSRLATFDQCALLSKFDMEYREHWNSHPAARGQIFHRFAAKALNTLWQMDERTIEVEDALTILRECLRQHDVEARDVVTIPYSQIKDLRWVVIKFAHENVFDVQYLAEVEQRLSATVRYDNPTGGWVEREVTGQLDALFIPEPDWAVVLDWKDTWALPPISDLSEEGYFQQRVYGFLVFKRYPNIQRVTLREHYPRHTATREATIFRTQLVELEEELGALVERFDRAVEHGTWPLPENPKEIELWKPSPGAHCAFCPRPAACPIFPDARVQGAIESPEMAERWAAEQVVAKAAAAQRDKALRAWAGARGPVPIKHAKDPNRVLGFQTQERTSRPTQEQLERALAEQGADLDPQSLFKTSTSTRFAEHSAEAGDSAEDAQLVSALEESVAAQRGKGKESGSQKRS